MKHEYMIDFDFTTVHRGSRFVGRNGQLNLNSIEEIDENSDKDAIESSILQYIHSQRPKWNIFMITIKKLTKVK